MGYRQFICLGIASLAVIVITGCIASDDSSLDLYQRLQAEDPALRIQAAREAANRKDRKAVGLLIDRLSDPEDDVRFFSHIALQKITGKDFGWQPWAPAADRQQAVRRWRAWWLEQQGADPAAATPTGAMAELTPGPAVEPSGADAPVDASDADEDNVTDQADETETPRPPGDADTSS